MALAPPLEVWNSMKSWKSGGSTVMALAPPLEVWNSMKSWKFHTATGLLLNTKRGKVLVTYFFTLVLQGSSFSSNEIKTSGGNVSRIISKTVIYLDITAPFTQFFKITSNYILKSNFTFSLAAVFQKKLNYFLVKFSTKK